MIHRLRSASGLALFTSSFLVSLFPYAAFAQEAQGPTALVRERHPAEFSLGVGPLVVIKPGQTPVTRPWPNLWLGGSENYLGFEVGLGTLQMGRRGAGHFQGNLLVNLVPDRGAARTIIPFLTLGTGTAFRPEGFVWTVNYGGGFKYFFNESVGLRIDVRDHILPRATGLSTHYLGIGGGIIFCFTKPQSGVENLGRTS